jgi:hypothetical protein
MTNTEEYLWERIGILERIVTEILITESETDLTSYNSDKHGVYDLIQKMAIKEASEADAKFNFKFDHENPWHESQEYWLCCGSVSACHNDERAKTCRAAYEGHPERCVYGTVEQHKRTDKEE